MNYEQYIRLGKLVASSFFKDLSEKEQQEFDNWLGEDPSNQILLGKIKNQQYWKKRDENIKLLDKDLIWGNIYKEISPAKAKRIFPFRKMMKYAASILILLAMVYGGWSLYENIQSDLDKPVAQIKPGVSKAQLIYGKQIIELGERDTIFNATDKSVAIEINSGKIKYQRDVLNKNTKEVHTIKIPRGGEYFLTLSDGTKVWLNSDTEIKYPAVFAENERRVYIQGEAFFEVAKESKRPFIVHANGLNIQVLGTKFNVSAYPDDDFVHVTLVEGKVFVNEQISGSKQSEILEPSQQAFVSRNDSQGLVVKNVDTDIYTSWKEGKYIFRNESLDAILKKLGRWYNIEVFYDDSKAKNSKFSGILPRFKNCETLLQLMEKTNSVKFEYTENSVLVKSVK